MRLTLTVAVLFIALAPAAGAHGVFEANELEVHVINDEGSDVIASYGGYDINEVFVGMAHTPAVGAGESGDGFYFRLELYGSRDEGVPTDQPWTISVRFDTASGPQLRTITTLDGIEFTSDFDALLVATDPLEVHVHRAFLSFANAGLAPGDALRGVVVESRVGGDLRDVAPGGIPVPGTNGAAEYPEATALPGRGTLVDAVALTAPTGYLLPAALDGTGGNYTVSVTSALRQGAQHIYLIATPTPGWEFDFRGPAGVAVEANGTAVFSFRAIPAPGAAPLAMDVLTDVGGRVPASIGPDGTLTVGAVTFTPAPPPVAESPAVGPFLGLALLGWAALARRRAGP